MKLNKKSIKSCMHQFAKDLTLPVLGALSICSLPALAADKSEITIYGNLDTGLEYLTNIGADGDSLIRVPGITGTMSSRLGFKASKDVGDGYQAFAVMEIGVSPDDGNHGQAGRIFGRQINFGLKTPIGKITLGRQYSPILFALGDLMGPNIYALGSLDAYLPNARLDNSVSWSNKLGSNVSAAVALSFGRDTTGAAPASGTCAGDYNSVGDSSACRTIAFMLKYKGDNFGLSLAADKQNGGTGASAFFFNGKPPVDMSDSGDTDLRYVLSGYYDISDAAKVSLGFLNRKLDTVANDISSTAIYLSGNYKVSAKTTVTGAIYNMKNDDQDADATLIALRAIYNIDKGVDWYTQLGQLSNGDGASYSMSPGPGTAPASGESQTGVMVGFRYKY